MNRIPSPFLMLPMTGDAGMSTPETDDDDIFFTEKECAVALSSTEFFHGALYNI